MHSSTSKINSHLSICVPNSENFTRWMAFPPFPFGSRWGNRWMDVLGIKLLFFTKWKQVKYLSWFLTPFCLWDAMHHILQKYLIRKQSESENWIDLACISTFSSSFCSEVLFFWGVDWTWAWITVGVLSEIDEGRLMTSAFSNFTASGT